jgi:hypothetical protein
MNFSIKAEENISSIIADEIIKQLEKEEVKDLVSLENNIRSVLKETGRQVYEKVLEKADQAHGKAISCPCGRQAQRISRRDAKLLTVFGWITYRRSYYGCSHCGEKALPLDQAWQIHPGEASPVMNKLLAIAGVEVSFDRARSHLAEFLMVDVSDNTIRKYTQEMGEKQAAIEADWIKESQDETWLQSRESKLKDIPDRLYGSMDGVQVPAGKEWRELKTLTWYQVAPVYGQENARSQEISYHCDIAPAEKFGDLLWATGVKRSADKAKELVFVCDGAVWIWNLISHYFPDAVQIVDWYHACEYLTPIATILFSEEAKKKRWLQKTKTWLWQGKIEKVLRECQKHLHSLAATAAQTAITYFSNNRHRMKYDEYRKKGYAIGSGTVESACKQIATARLKIAGARWTLDGLVMTAKARAAWLTNAQRFDMLCRPLAT